MKWRSIPLATRVVLACIVLSAPGVFAALSAHAAADVLTVVNDSVPEESLSADAVQEIFLGRKTRWSDGQKIVPATLKQGQAHEDFLKGYIRKTPHQFRDYWRRLVFTGRGSAPDVFDFPEDLVEFVKKTPGAIGYLPASLYQYQLKSLAIE